MRTILQLLATAAVSVLLAMPAAAQVDPAKVEIRAEPLGPGVAVLFGAGGNMGVSHGPDGTVLIDDQFAPLTPKIAKAIADLGGTPVKYVVNTHWHYDHTGGNENLGKTGATIFAHDNVRVRMAAGATLLGRVIPPAPPIALPVVTYADGITFHLNGDQIHAVNTGGGHTDGDTVLHWAKANVVHTGDLMMSDAPFPFIDVSSGGNAVNLVASLDKVLAMTDDKTKVIPGHGPVTDKAGLKAWRDRIAGGLDTVRQARAKGQSLEAFLAANPFKPMDREGAFVNSEAFARAVWASLDSEATAKKHDHGPAHKH
ncbi:Hydroxyacylglutathione hydrolase [Tsuneonella dongtanensis]|uniref:Hydroxyacylglutathione hydrolase n=1 Tax=Tsuneonella dongtanensis TaxID=692370 RepID=A0A1B2AFI7_9SPHN|nr:MBL fold metallo-hydrolase [Tsuneonella dongtanensis]ANY20858.1 Hydroxyacylglutathione hydrolase [Tsuneonella dongtanensis]